ncbi:hypothetical protein [Bacillus velezensis]
MGEEMKGIEKEVGEKEGKRGEVEWVREKIEEGGMGEGVKERGVKELRG